MFEKNLRYAYLLDFYGSLFDEHTESVMKAYYDDDLSLAEVADGVGISRQGVRHIIKKGEELLEFYEERLELAKKAESFECIVSKLEGIRDEIAAGGITATGDITSSLSDVISALSEHK